MRKFIWPLLVLLFFILAACGSGDVSGISGTYNARYDENNPHEVVALIDASLTFDGAGGVIFEDSKLKLIGTYTQTSGGYKIMFEEIEAAAALVIGSENLPEQTMSVTVKSDGSLTVEEDATHLSFDEAEFYLDEASKLLYQVPSEGAPSTDVLLYGFEIFRDIGFMAEQQDIIRNTIREFFLTNYPDVKSVSADEKTISHDTNNPDLTYIDLTSDTGEVFHIKLDIQGSIFKMVVSIYDESGNVLN